jgi:HEAT repeat protein
LAKLLKDPELASWARIALEAIPGQEVDAALRDALSSLQGELLVGAINSIGYRRDEAAVEALAKQLASPDVDVMAAAAAALGRIGNAAASDLLESNLSNTNAAVRTAAAEGCIYCAERSWTKADSKRAVRLYDQVRKSQVPVPRIIEATRGAILTRGADGISLLIEQLNSAEKEFFALGLQTLREFPGSAGDKALFAEIHKLSPEKGALVLQALVERPGPTSVDSILDIAQKEQGLVQIAAVKALGKMGDATCVNQLITSAVNSNSELSTTAKASLAELSGEDVDREIVGRLKNADRQTLPILLELVGLRQVVAVDELVKALGDSDAKVRSAALTSLGSTVPADRLDVLVNQVIKPRTPEDSSIALAALKAAAIRMPDRDKCANDLSVALNKNTGPTAASLLEIIGAVGGTKALETVAMAARSKDAQLQNVATRLLGEWMTIDAAPVLFDLSQQLTDAKFQTRAVKGYLRICRQFTMAEDDRVTMCRQAWQICKQPAEKKLLLEILKRYPSPGTLRLAADARQVVEIKDEATATMLAIAQKLGGANGEIEKLLSEEGLRKIKLEILQAEYGAGANRIDVTKVVQNCAKDQAWIVLPSPNYNSAFGSDPAPGTPKQLKIQFRIDGKDGEIDLPENSLILLPSNR